MKGYTLDYYEKWERVGILDKRLNEIKELVSKAVPQVEIAKILGMSKKTIYKL
ncbi:MAG: helix-turn-helix domain-containing protein [Candidatus Izemoplasmataceae bacterium]